MIHHIHRATRHLIFWTLVGTALALTALRLLLFSIDHYKTNLATNLGEAVGAPVTIGRIGAKMRGFSPELILKDLTIQQSPTNHLPALKLPEVRLGANLLEIVRNRQLWSSAWVKLIGAQLMVLRKPDGKLVIAGINGTEGSPEWLLQAEKLVMLHSRITFEDQKTKAKALLFNDVDLVLTNSGASHKLNLVTDLPKVYGQSLQLSLDLTGDSLTPAGLQGKIYLEGKQLRLAELISTELPSGLQIHAGTGDFRVWADWAKAQPQAITLLAELQQARFTRAEYGSYTVKELKTRMDWQQAGLDWQLDVNQFALHSSDKKWPDTPFKLAGKFTEERTLSQLGGYFPKLELQQATELAQYFLPLSAPALKQLANLKLRGTLAKTAVFMAPADPALAVNSRFENLTIATLQEPAEAGAFSGHLKGTEQQGTLELQLKKGQLIAPALFRRPLVIEQLSGAVNWRQAADKWLLSSDRLLAELPALSGKGRMKLELPKNNSGPVLQLESSFSSSDMSKAPLYLPIGVMSKSLVAWLDQAFITGRIPQGQLLINGNLRQFPFQNTAGQFKVSFDAEQLELAYHPDWPHLSNLAGNVQFLKNGVQIKVNRGQTGELKIRQADIKIPDLGDKAQLEVKGEANGDFRQGLAFLQKTPLKSSLKGFQDAIAIQGRTDVLLNMTIPLVENKPSKTEVITTLNDASLMVKALDLPVNRINGPVKFTEQGIYSDGLKAVALAQPIKIRIGRSRQHTLVNIDGRAAVQELAQQFKLPWWSVAKGATDYQLALTLPDSAVDPLALEVKSNLEGISLDLPGDLAKTALQRRPLALTFDLNQKLILPITLDYDHQLKAALKFAIAQGRLSSGHVVVGSGTAKFSNDPGLALEINRDRLPVQDWLAFALSQNKASVGSTPITHITIHSDHALWKTTDIGRFDLSFKPQQRSWEGQLNSQFAAGRIRLPAEFTPTEKITVTLQKLDLSSLTKLKASGSSGTGIGIAPTAMPLFSLNSDKTLWQEHDLGMLHVETERIPAGIIFKHIDIFGHDQKLTATGDWKVSGSSSQTQLQGRLEMPQAGNFLKNLGITKDVSEASGTADFLLHWAGAPFLFSSDKLQGQLTLNLNRGRILSIEPGFGRILGVLALAQWIDRLQLDFSDIYQEGLTFHTIKGRFDVSNGNAVNQNLIIDAIPAKITLTGNVNLAERTVDQVVNVTPKSAEAIPIAGTIMGKLSAFVAKTLTGKDQEGFFLRSQYAVKGKWGEVEIKPLHENDGLLQKAWDGISKFPWIKQPATK